MATQSEFLDLRPLVNNSPRSSRAHSPRIEHFDGEVPPTLSPLDAFAAQGRLLAKQLDDSKRRDRRMSRLPPASVARSLSQPRPGYFRSPKLDPPAEQATTRSPEQGGISPALEEPKFRPQSQHPRLSGLSIFEGEDSSPASDEASVTQSFPERQHGHYFTEVSRAESPETDTFLPSLIHSKLVAPTSNPRQKLASPGSTDSLQPMISSTLAPPTSPFPSAFHAARAPHPESSDDDYTSSNAGSTFSKPRKLSSSSGISQPHSPISPFIRSHPRSPSVSSEMSGVGNLWRPSFNFSRPLSRSSTNLSAPSPIIPNELISGPSIQGIQRDSRPDPITVPDLDVSQRVDEEALASGVSTYIYSKYSLPRGRTVSRNSVIFSGLQTPHFEWKEPLFASSPPLPPREGSTPSPTRPSPVLTPPSSESSKRSASTAASTSSPSVRLRKSKSNVDSATPRRMSSPTRRSERSSLILSRQLPRSQSDTLDDSKSTSGASGSTIRPVTGPVPISSIHDSAEEHVNKGIECHEKGALQESTYHLRIAARQNHPTGMLLYALACRHGWGMRPNQREGVQWLRKAVDSAGLEVGDGDRDLSPKEAAEQKKRRVQFALGIYELGVSHLNGWGTEQDKILALRCFEIAGRWGDADALAEAGYCYAEGVGCKKDLKKAAKYYRMAEAKGMNIVGNSWIYKEKYMSDDDSSRPRRGRQASTTEKLPRSKSRTRSIFGRKKSMAA